MSWIKTRETNVTSIQALYDEAACTATEWHNGDGIDVMIQGAGGEDEKMISISWDQFEALHAVVMRWWAIYTGER